MNSYIQSAEAIANAAVRRPTSAAGQRSGLRSTTESLFGWGGPPDFQPRFRQLCTTDRTLTDKSVKNLINRIQGGQEGRRHIPSVAEVMDQAFLAAVRAARWPRSKGYSRPIRPRRRK